MKLNKIEDEGKWSEHTTRLNSNFNKISQETESLKSTYKALTQSDVLVVSTLPQQGVANTIYRVVGNGSYSDYMYNSDDLSTPILMATYNNAIDTYPQEDSENLITSGAVYESYANQVYLDDQGEASIPDFNPQSDSVWSHGVQEISAANQKQVRANLGFGDGDIDEVPTAGSENLVKSGGVAEITDIIGRNAITVRNSGYVKYSDGTVEIASIYNYSNNIQVNEGDVYAICCKGSINTAAVAAYDSNNNYLKGKSVNYQETEFERFLYVVPKDVNHIVITGSTTETISAVLLSPDTLNTLFSINNNLPKESIFIPNISTGFIKYDDGTIGSGGQYRYSDYIDVQENDVYEYNGGVSATVALVAMYDSSKNYVKSSSIKGNGIASTFKFTIPDGIFYIRLCNNVILTPSENLAISKINPLYNDFTTEEDVENIVSDNLFETVGRNKNRIPTTRKAVFSFVFDDLRTSDKNVFDIFESFGFIPSYALDYQNITEDNIVLYKDMYVKGCSILGHGSTSNATQIKDAYKTLTNLGFVINGFVTPSSILSDNLKPLAASIYGYCFTESPNAQNVLPSTTVGKYDNNASRFALSRIGLETWNKDSDPSLVYLKSCVDDAIANNLFIVFYGHQIPSSYKNTDGVTSVFTTEDLQNLLQYIKSKVNDCQCSVLSADEAVSYYYNMVNPS